MDVRAAAARAFAPDLPEKALRADTAWPCAPVSSPAARRSPPKRAAPCTSALANRRATPTLVAAPSTAAPGPPSPGASATRGLGAAWRAARARTSASTTRPGPSSAACTTRGWRRSDVRGGGRRRGDGSPAYASCLQVLPPLQNQRRPPLSRKRSPRCPEPGCEAVLADTSLSCAAFPVKTPPRPPSCAARPYTPVACRASGRGSGPL